MRKLLVLVVLLALLAPSAAWSLRRSPGDGTLSVVRAQDYVALNVRGAVLGRTSGYLEIVDPKGGDCSAESVWGSRIPRESETRTGLLVCRYTGTSLRFRLVGGRQWVRVWGPDIFVSAVGRGDLWLRNRDEDRVGTYSLDGERPSALPTRLTQFTLGAVPTSARSG